MEFTCQQIRENARSSLKGNWILMGFFTLLYNNLDIIIDFIPSINSDRFSIIVTFISTALFIFGYNNIILQITRGNNIKFSTFFSGCKKVLKGFLMNLVIGIYTLLWSMLFIIPGIIANIKYSMAYFIWADDPDIGIDEAINESINMTDGHKWEIFKLFFSFIGWFLLLIALGLGIEFIIEYYITDTIFLLNNIVLIIFSIGFIYLEAYFKVSMGVLYNKLIGFKEIEENKFLLDE